MPGQTKRLEPVPDHGERTYRGYGRGRLNSRALPRGLKRL